jgi:hypothetical protein
LRRPVAERLGVHVYVRESGGSGVGIRSSRLGSPGSRGLGQRALGGIALCLAPFLSRRHR